ncbi:MAG: hypothetical protein Q4G22_12040 [Paracoccus sp. (in: a-proteobacteria)]|uniref:hypothetical protein n=1 Tax=Paracoccus sp. TaxID=267 RepID=UPI0026E0E8C3|nr:hypothetical protein [Paracoccus sp. (in: a-proteobacteria)]MDO5632552.1 hypothetical protein [Paracoccus sp. (in: a-proteobacteria)]
MRVAFVLAVLLAAPVAGTADPVHLPLDAMGQVVIQVVDNPTGGNRVFIVDQIEESSAPDGTVAALFWLWPNMTGWPDVQATGPDRFTAYSGCDATCGRWGNVYEYKAVRRNGAWVLAGFTRVTNDRIEASVTVCDVNLLTSAVEKKFLPSDGEDRTETLTTTARAMPLSDLTGDYMVPECADLP